MAKRKDWEALITKALKGKRMNFRDLAAAIECAPAHMGKACIALEAKGIITIEQAPNPSNGRVQCICSLVCDDGVGYIEQIKHKPWV